MVAAGSPAFHASLTGRLRALGLEGAPVTVRVEGGVLVLTGAASGRVLIPAGRLVRMRAGFAETKSRRFYACQIWLDDPAMRITLHPFPGHLSSYAEVVRSFARDVSEAAGLSRIEQGDSALTALLLPGLMGMLSAAALILAAVVLENEPWWGRLLVPVVPLLLFGITSWLALTRYWPRPVTRLADLDRQLPA